MLVCMCDARNAVTERSSMPVHVFRRYGSFVLYCTAVLITSPVLLVLQNKGVLIPRVGDPVSE